MTVLLIADEARKAAWLSTGQTAEMELIVSEEITEAPADACIDLLFDGSAERIASLTTAKFPLVLVHSLETLLKNLPDHFVRINGWLTFLERNIVEACAPAPQKPATEVLLKNFNRTLTWVPDITGLLSARVVAGIINEAYLALEEGLSTAEEIDTAMKLGTNYPYGPLEWCDRIGKKHVQQLLRKLHAENLRYQPAEGLSVKE